jgi:hypothetical protein
VTGNPGDNGSCQINGGTTSFFGSCTGHNSNGTTFSNGHDLSGGWGRTRRPLLLLTPCPVSALLQTHAASTNPCSFDFGLVSIQGPERSPLPVRSPAPDCRAWPWYSAVGSSAGGDAAVKEQWFLLLEKQPRGNKLGRMIRDVSRGSMPRVGRSGRTGLSFF